VSAKPTGTPESTTRDGAAPLASIVIPVYNEEGLISASIVELIERMKELDFPYEILICENGSSDDTVEIALQLERKYPQVRVLSSDEPNYGKALRNGILQARGDFVLCDEIDILDTRFYRRALAALRADQCDMVVGSKLHPDSLDRRPVFRTFATRVINLMLRVAVGFKGTDTHGLKAFRRDRLLPVVNRCVVDKDLFASELVIRTERAEFRVLEVPVEIVEKRKPSINLVKRVPNVLRNMVRLFVAIRLRG